MSLWVDRYRPKSFKKLDFHKKQAQDLSKLVNAGNFPHLLVFGPSGAGKKTRIMCLLKELYGSGVEKLRIKKHEFTTPSKKKLEIATLASNYHIEVTPSDAGMHDRVVIQELIKTVAQSNQLEIGSQRNFKVVVVNEADRLTKEAQHALRRTMEKYMSTCRLILYCNSTTKMIPAIRSRCLSVRVAAPTEMEIVNILESTCQKEGLTIPRKLATRIAEVSDRNLRLALLMCETCKIDQYPFTEDQQILEPDWKVYVRETANLMINEQTTQQVMEIRKRMYELISKCIPVDMIIRVLYDELSKNVDGSLKRELTSICAEYEHKAALGSKKIYHLEALVCKFMCVYKEFLQEGFANMF